MECAWLFKTSAVTLKFFYEKLLYKVEHVLLDFGAIKILIVIFLIIKTKVWVIGWSWKLRFDNSQYHLKNDFKNFLFYNSLKHSVIFNFSASLQKFENIPWIMGWEARENF